MSAIEWSPGAAGPVLRLVPVADPHDVTWRDFAACAEADPDAWYPERGGTSRYAVKVCAGCPVAAQCLEYALTHMEHTHDAGMYGIWAGTSPNDRKRLKRGRLAEEAA